MFGRGRLCMAIWALLFGHEAVWKQVVWARGRRCAKTFGANVDILYFVSLHMILKIYDHRYGLVKLG